jgi:hypothetical protein
MILQIIYLIIYGALATLVWVQPWQLTIKDP